MSASGRSQFSKSLRLDDQQVIRVQHKGGVLGKAGGLPTQVQLTACRKEEGAPASPGASQRLVDFLRECKQTQCVGEQGHTQCGAKFCHCQVSSGLGGSGRDSSRVGDNREAAE